MKRSSRIAAGLALMTAATAMAQQPNEPQDLLHSILNASGPTATTASAAQPAFTHAPFTETDFLTHGTVTLPVARSLSAVYPSDTKEQVLTLAGEPTTTVLTAPIGATATAAVLLIPGIEGLDNDVRGHAELYSRRGLLALVVDLYGGVQPKDRREAIARLRKIDREKTLARLRDAETWLAEKTKFGRLKFGVAGYGLGADWALALAAEEPKPAAIALFYGGATNQLDALRQSGVPLIGFFSRQDLYMTPARVEAFEKSLKQAGIRHELISYHVEPNFAIQPRQGAARNYAASAVDRTINLIAAGADAATTPAAAQSAATAGRTQP